MITIDICSDLHGHYPELEGGDLLILAGDYTAGNKMKQWMEFYTWLQKQPYRKKVYIGGNHDGLLASSISTKEANEMGLLDGQEENGIEYILDNGTEFEGLKIWGSPWVRSFNGMNPKAKAFTVDLEIQLKEKFDLIPGDTDILITHSPPFGILDGVRDMSYGFENQYKRRCGSTALEYRLGKVLPRLHVFGHIHENGGQKEYYYDGNHSTLCVNASLVNERYEMVNKPVRIIL